MGRNCDPARRENHLTGIVISIRIKPRRSRRARSEFHRGEQYAGRAPLDSKASISKKVSFMSHDNSILVLGAGELGMAVLRKLARANASSANTSIAVLLRQSTIDSTDPTKQKDIAELRYLGIELVAGDLASQSEAALADSFRRFKTVISCTGFVGGKGVQMKLARAALSAQIQRYFPWQFGVDYDVIGRG